MKFRLLHILVVSMWSVFSYGQLAPFTMNVAVVNETCPFKGSVSITLENRTPGSDIKYRLYLLPNTTTPIAQFTQNTRGNLDSGNYRLIAIQQLNGASNTQTADFSIADQTVPLLFSLTASTGASCDDTGGIFTIDVTSGRAPFLFEIFSGPVTYSPQTSNVFTNLAAGTYKIRVTDGCGNAEVLEYALILDTTTLTIGAVSTPPVLSSCTSIEVLNTVIPAAGTNIIYPLTVKYTIHKPPAPDQIIQDVQTSGPPDNLQLSITLPLETDAYTYDVRITDTCNNPFESLGNTINPEIVVSLDGIKNECGDESLVIAVSNFTPPYTVQFTDAPSDFVPVDFNPDHNGSFSGSGITYGDDENTVPPGDYSILITDSCGRTMTADYLVQKDPLQWDPVITMPSCNNPLGAIEMTIPDDRKIVSAVLVSAPPEYTQPLPQTFGAPTINPDTGIFKLSGLPPNDTVPYVFVITDSCGDSYDPVEALIKNFTISSSLVTTARFSCEEGHGSLRVRSPNGILTSIIVIDAPDAFNQTLPFNATSLISSNGILFLSNLPGGNYEFAGSDGCNTPLSGSLIVPSYNPGTNNYILQRNCGSFHITVSDNSNLIGNYFLQRLDPVTNFWEHPDTGVDQTNPAVPPNLNNSLQLANGSVLLNRTALGRYRIVKTIPTFENGSSVCFEEYEPFDFFDDLVIKRAYTLDCEGGSGANDVYLDLEGVPPYTFRIRQDTAQPFTPVSVTNNTYENLSPGVFYEIQVEDSCGNQRVLPIELSTLLPLAVANDPVDANGNSEMLICTENNETTGIFDIELFEPLILGNQSPGSYSVTYHLTQQQADTGTNALDSPYTSTSAHQTIYARVVHKTIGICYDTTHFDLYVGKKPVITTSADAFICDNTPVTLRAQAGFQQYLWSTGETTPSITVTSPGTYTVTAANVYGTSICESDPVSITVTPSGVPTKIDFETSDWTDNRNSITVIPNGAGDYEYSLDGINYQDSPVFTNLAPGIYKIFVNDKNQCGQFHDEVVLLNYPKYFTPNGDGHNDRWQIQYAAFEPDMQIYIFDRFGKLLTGFGSKSTGWDGTYNGRQMPSTDYWFVVERANGRTLRGHFAMKR